MKLEEKDIRVYTDEELEDIVVPNPMETDTDKQLNLGYTLLLGSQKTGKILKNWSVLAIVKEYRRVVRILVEKGKKASKKDTILIRTLPEDLRKKFE